MTFQRPRARPGCGAAARGSPASSPTLGAPWSKVPGSWACGLSLLCRVVGLAAKWLRGHNHRAVATDQLQRALAVSSEGKATAVTAQTAEPSEGHLLPGHAAGDGSDEEGAGQMRALVGT